MVVAEFYLRSLRTQEPGSLTRLYFAPSHIPTGVIPRRVMTTGKAGGHDSDKF
jgi:hypothetical protein